MADRDEHGLVAEYETEEALVRAIERARALGYREIDALSPYRSERVIEALRLGRSRLAAFTLAGGIAGGAGTYAALYWMRVVDFPLNVGGRPLHAWPVFVPLTFEMTVLIAALATFFAFWWMCGLPRLSHPILATEGIERASDDRFFLVVPARDHRFDRHGTRAHLEETGALAVRPWGEARDEREDTA